ncbi:DUF6559 family protein [Leptolyngbya sp. 7M]|uniref:DUF6559 family protein n=1 Tax=Leptolyngbya sp. 7M TaxID=2812896 RepID=UPI001B8A9752|nr:DUF6559 family protein [Leptolyngbya sp. 7M]QYO67087.1 hypothetical protein JVX88_09910 [Leptolyngbya sp. 7M]
MIQHIQKWLAIRSYAKNLGSKLRKRYGASRYYTPGQVKTTVREAGLDLKLVRYALCMYCDRSSFIQYHIDLGEAYDDYDSIRNEIAAQFSRNRVSFNEVVSSSMVINQAIYGYDGGGHFSGGSCDNGGTCDS